MSTRIAFLATDGVEQVELTKPWDELSSAGFQVELLSNKGDRIQGFHHRDKGDTFPVDRLVGQADPSEFGGLVLPGGVVNPDRLRMDPDAVGFVKSFFDRGTPVAAICHAPWLLVEADVVRGRTLTSWPSLKTDIRNAGGEWIDEEVVEDDGLVTSRSPDDLVAFCKKSIEIFGG
jgi:protease I